MRRTNLSGLLAGCFLLAISSVADAEPITYANWLFPPSGVGETTTVDGPTEKDFATVDIISAFGVNRISVTSKESSAFSAWLDEWTVTGGTGTGMMEVQWSLDGTLTVTDTLACPSCDSASIRYGSLFGAGSVFGGTDLFSASRIGTGTTVVQQSGTVFVPFTYGTTFTAGFRLGGTVGDDLLSGSVNFFNSAIITAVILPAGASLSTTSTGVEYPVQQTTPVPEPATVLLLAAGLMAAGIRTRRAPRTRAGEQLPPR